ncbi:MAG: nucleotidyltransferase family protein [Chloroflexi bacterium]|nr:nucleotidyltransferase family protein [Chloroflexota bacterium]
MAEPKIKIPKKELAEFCRRWKITEFSLFGSALRADFGPKSDVDALVSFSPDAHWTFFDLANMQQELESLFDQPVDLISRRGLESSRNYIRRKAILESAEVIYAT